MQEFDSSLSIEDVKIDNVPYEIRELTTAGRKKYLRDVSNKMEVRMVSTGTGKNGDKTSTMRREILLKDLAGSQEALLSETMFQIAEDGSKKAVTPKQIDAWGTLLTEKLVAIASRLNKLEQTDEQLDEEASKN